MFLRTCGRTIGDICGNDMLERADALVREMRVPARYQDDARQEACLAQMEERDPKRAVERYVRKEKSCGLTGDNTDMPKVVRSPSRLNTEDNPERVLTRREEEAERADVGARAWNTLTAREQEIVRLRAMGWTQVEIANHLRLGQQHVSRLLTKIAIKSRT